MTINNGKNTYGEYFVVCIDCEVPHIQNCGSCFGWGFFNGKNLVSASMAHHFKEEPQRYYLVDIVVCEECGSSIRGTE